MFSLKTHLICVRSMDLGGVQGMLRGQSKRANRGAEKKKTKKEMCRTGKLPWCSVVTELFHL